MHRCDSCSIASGASQLHQAAPRSRKDPTRRGKAGRPLLRQLRSSANDPLRVSSRGSDARPLPARPLSTAAGKSGILQTPVSPACSESPQHALVWGLRATRRENQLTNVVASISATDRRFAEGFVDALIAQTYDDCPHTREVGRRLRPLPLTIRGGRERTLYDERGKSLGRVDLTFADASAESDFILLVENKLYAGFEPTQLERYRAGLRLVRGSGGRGAVVAVTRVVPTRGELHQGDPEWLGCIRWARLVRRLRHLEIVDTGVGAQWRLLLDVLEHQGDLGMTELNSDAVRAWARYREGREQLELLLDQIAGDTLEHVRQELKRAYRIGGDATSLAAFYIEGNQVTKSTLEETWLGVSVPADYVDYSLRVMVWMETNRPLIGVEVTPRGAASLLNARNPTLLKQLRALTELGFKGWGSAHWHSEHEAEPLLSSPDAPQALLTIVRREISAIVETGILRRDAREPVREDLRRARPRRSRWR